MFPDEKVFIVFVLLFAFSIALNLVLIIRERSFGKKKVAEEAPHLEAPPQKGERDCYERFLPEELLKWLNKKRYSEISAADQQYASAVIMELNTVNFREFSHGKAPEEIFTYINGMVGQAIPIIYENRGIVERFSEGGLTAFFRENQERAMETATAVCEKMSELSRQEPEYQAVTVGMTYGSVMIGAVGHEKRMSLLVLSEMQQFARFLQSIGGKYGAKIISTGELLEAIPDCGKKFHYRLLGYVYMRTTGTVEKIYDVFDGDVVEVRNKKRKTKMVFEKGVNLFMRGQISEARLHFVEVMKMDRDDRGAKEYLLRCDRRLNGEADGNLFLENF